MGTIGCLETSVTTRNKESMLCENPKERGFQEQFGFNCSVIPLHIRMAVTTTETHRGMSCFRSRYRPLPFVITHRVTTVVTSESFLSLWPSIYAQRCQQMTLAHDKFRDMVLISVDYLDTKCIFGVIVCAHILSYSSCDSVLRDCIDHQNTKQARTFNP